jgi:hypothetical protein
MKSQAKGVPDSSKIKGIENSMNIKKSIPARPSTSLLVQSIAQGTL